MRKTLHEYVIEFDSNAQTIRDSVMDFTELVCKYAEITNRAPRLGDFVPCDEEGNVLENPDIHYLDHSIAVALNYEYQTAKDKVIFDGFEYKKLKHGVEQLKHKDCKIWIEHDRNTWTDVTTQPKSINRIEDLPREIEFKDEVI
jgi:hypothetical protein